MKLPLASALLLAVFTAPAMAMNTDLQSMQMLTNVDSAGRCSAAAAGTVSAADGLSDCDTALSDQVAPHRAALLVDRGIVKFRLGQPEAAVADYDAALALAPDLGEGYVNRAAALEALGRTDAAMQDVRTAIRMGAPDLHVAYYTRATAEDFAGNYTAAYRDYQKALALKPGYEAASRELARFEVAPRELSSNK